MSKEYMTSNEIDKYLKDKGFSLGGAIYGPNYMDPHKTEYDRFSAKNSKGHYCLVVLNKFKVYGKTKKDLLAILPEKYHKYVCV
ncbi:MAG: hypothetical protein KAS32_27015 [Candidatus Peribacteraceae bacterium]|nr:hypothetical protein [Candidatus Peribacteraceae bacterium]